jgi:hypothetical protein
MTDPHEAIARWVSRLPAETTSERVHADLWYVRIPGVARSWIPVEILVGDRTVKLTSHLIIEPEERQDEVYKLLLRHNHKASGVSFSFEGREGVICLVARIGHGSLTEDSLDRHVGTIVETTEVTFRTILEIGFGRRLRRSRRG